MSACVKSTRTCLLSSASWLYLWSIDLYLKWPVTLTALWTSSSLARKSPILSFSSVTFRVQWQQLLARHLPSISSVRFFIWFQICTITNGPLCRWFLRKSPYSPFASKQKMTWLSWTKKNFDVERNSSESQSLNKQLRFIGSFWISLAYLSQLMRNSTSLKRSTCGTTSLTLTATQC